jgi:AraC-like DNA-binding protein
MKVNTQAALQVNERLKTKLPQLVPEPGKFLTAIEGLYLYRRNENSQIGCFNEPILGVIVQGEKRAVVADEEYRYGEGSYIAYGMDLPSVSHIVGASAKKPHLALSLHLDRYILSQLAAGVKPASDNKVYKGVTVAAATADPLQFQKKLRLYEAQRLMLMENNSAEIAAFAVGYESPAQFSREYKRQFGEPPHRDINRILEGV